MRKWDRVLRAGYTLIEVVVVVVLLGLSAALAVPMLVSPRDGASGVERLIARARETALQRGEVVYLRVEPSGEWRMEAGGVTERAGLAGSLARGRIVPLANAPLTLRVAPTGSCAFDVRSFPAAAPLAVALPTCSIPRTLR